MRAGAGWQAHLGEPKRWEARRRRFSPPSRAHLAIIRRVGDAAASSLTCGTHCSSVRSSPSWRPATLQGARHSPCSVAGLQLGLERTDERCVPQHGSDANREETSDLCHLPPDLTWNWSSQLDLRNWEIGFGRVGRSQAVSGKHFLFSCVKPVKACQGLRLHDRVI